MKLTPTFVYFLTTDKRLQIQAKRKLDELADPARFEARKEYNKEYYQKNKEKILLRRAAAYASKKKANAQPVR